MISVIIPVLNETDTKAHGCSRKRKNQGNGSGPFLLPCGFAGHNLQEKRTKGAGGLLAEPHSLEQQMLDAIEAQEQRSGCLTFHGPR